MWHWAHRSSNRASPRSASERLEGYSSPPGRKILSRAVAGSMGTGRGAPSIEPAQRHAPAAASTTRTAAAFTTGGLPWRERWAWYRVRGHVGRLSTYDDHKIKERRHERNHISAGAHQTVWTVLVGLLRFRSTNRLSLRGTCHLFRPLGEPCPCAFRDEPHPFTATGPGSRQPVRGYSHADLSTFRVA